MCQGHSGFRVSRVPNPYISGRTRARALNTNRTSYMRSVVLYRSVVQDKHALYSASDSSLIDLQRSSLSSIKVKTQKLLDIACVNLVSLYSVCSRPFVT